MNFESIKIKRIEQKKYLEEYPNEPNPYNLELTFGVDFINDFIAGRNGRKIVVEFVPGRFDSERLVYV